MKPSTRVTVGAGSTLRKTIEDHKQNPSINYDMQTPNILRTIYLPNDQSQQLRSEVDTLHAQIQEQRVHYERILLKMRDDRSNYEEQQRVRYLQVTEEIEHVLQQLQEQEIFNYQIVRDHVELMSQYEADERRL